jgi:hypothetical protein
MGQKLVAQTFAGAGPGHQTGDVDNLYRSWYNSLRVDDFGQLRETIVGNSDSSNIGLDGTKREIGCLSFRVRQAVK